MKALLGIHSLSKAYGSVRLFKGLSFAIHEGDRVGLIGPNGAGKSTLLKILMGLEPQDSGSITSRQNLRLAYAEQDPSFVQNATEATLVQEALGDDVVEKETKARILLSKADFVDPTACASLLSGGWKKRLSVLQAVISEPDLLLLDEPTNHLDLEGILWLEQFLKKEMLSFLVVSHDRYFLENVCNRIIEINPCYPEGLFDSAGTLSDYLERKEAFLEAQMQKERSLRATSRQEVEWLKRSPKARTTKSTSRVKRAYELLDDLNAISQRNTSKQVALDFSASERETKKLIVLKNICKAYHGKYLFKNLDLTLSPGARVALMGKNGTGKSTLMKVLAGKLAPDMGTRKCADDLKIVYFDQHREHIDPNLTLREALSPAGEMVRYRGQDIHVNGFAKRFLFTPDKLSMPVRCLSGGERARILIAKLILEPADILFLDEPTNDLDIPTLEVIEESLQEFQGALVLISHDRCLIDRIATQVVGLGSESSIPEIYADYNQWEEADKKASTKEVTKEKIVATQPVKGNQKKLSFKEQKELEGIEEKIMVLENQIADLEKQLNENPEGYKQLAGATEALEALFNRWQLLLDKAKT